ncbi:MAG: carboxylating nicotinate-nucleotide diphosphorylase [Synechocystis sp.]|nr:carboxylating nicotinate-nucleotide diphosphorylase [Synechocystis sp.]
MAANLLNENSPMTCLPPWLVIDPLLQQWLAEDIGRGDWSTQGLGLTQRGNARWVAKQAGTIAGLPIAARVFQLLDPTCQWQGLGNEGQRVQAGTVVSEITGHLASLLTGERVALNLAMRLSGIATMTQQYVQAIADYPTQFVDTRKTTPGLRLLEKYASRVGGAVNHRMGLDDAVMIKDNHIQAAGGITNAVCTVRQNVPYPLTIEVETSTLTEVETAIAAGVDIIMLDNMGFEEMATAVTLIRQANPLIRIEASGNVTLETLAGIAATGVDYISSSAPITRSPWLDLSMQIL